MDKTKLSGIYKIENLVNGKVYIGSALNLKERYRLHVLGLIQGHHHNIHLQRAWNKYGGENFIFSVIETVNYPDELIKREQLWMNYYNVRDNGYNFCPIAGSSLGVVRSERTRERMSVAKSGKNHPNYGKRLPKETRKRMSEAKMGDKNPAYGKPSPLRGILSKEWEVISPDGELTVIKNLCGFCKQHDLDAGTMVKVSKGKRPHHKKWKCRKLKEGI